MPANPEPCNLTTKEMVNLYNQGLGTYKIAALANRNQSTIVRRLNDVGIKMRPAHSPRLYDLDHSFFDEIDTPEKAYILGFFMADGCVIQWGPRKRLQFHLQSRDVDLLRKMAAAMKMTNPIHYREKYVELVWNSPQQFDALARFGIVPNKTFTGLEYPHSLQDSLHRHFIRGLIDGDGWVCRDKFGLCGSSLVLLTTVRQVILDHVPLVRPLGRICLTKKDPNFYRWLGYPPQATVLHWLYDGASIALERKLSVVKEHWS